MKQEFQMTQENMDDILAINKNNCNVVMKIGSYETSNSLAESINRYWKKMGDEHGFDHMSVEGSSKSPLHFLATPKLVVIPKTPEELALERYIRGMGGISSDAFLDNVLEEIKKMECLTASGRSLEDTLAFEALKDFANHSKK